MSAVLEPGATWRTRMPRGVLDPRCPHGEPVTTPTDRRMLWHLESVIAVTAAGQSADSPAITAETCADTLGRLAALAPWPSPDGPVTAQAVAAWLAVDAQRCLHRNRPGTAPDRADLRAAPAELIAVHVLVSLHRMLSGVPDAMARYLVEVLADAGAAAELLWAHLEELGIEPGAVNRLEDALSRAPASQDSAPAPSHNRPDKQKGAAMTQSTQSRLTAAAVIAVLAVAGLAALASRNRRRAARGSR